MLRRVRLLNPIVLRTVLPPIAAAEGRQVIAVQRLGKRVGKRVGKRLGKRMVLALQGDLFLVIHLMIAGAASWC